MPQNREEGAQFHLKADLLIIKGLGRLGCPLPPHSPPPPIRFLRILFFQKRKLLIWKTNSTKHMNLISCTVPSLYFLNASHIVICKDLDWHRDVFVWCRHKANPCKIRLNPRQRPQICNCESRCKSSPSSTFYIASWSQILQIHKRHSLIPAQPPSPRSKVMLAA